MCEVVVVSLLSKSTPPLEVVMAKAKPLLGTVPFTQSWTSGVTSIRMNWSAAAGIATGWFPVADSPRLGAFA
jgi:hypothetical protein